MKRKGCHGVCVIRECATAWPHMQESRSRLMRAAFTGAHICKKPKSREKGQWINICKPFLRSEALLVALGATRRHVAN